MTGHVIGVFSDTLSSSLFLMQRSRCQSGVRGAGGAGVVFLVYGGHVHPSSVKAPGEHVITPWVKRSKHHDPNSTCGGRNWKQVTDVFLKLGNTCSVSDTHNAIGLRLRSKHLRMKEYFLELNQICIWVKWVSEAQPKEPNENTKEVTKIKSRSLNKMEFD